MEIEVHCDDGTDRNCERTVKMTLPLLAVLPGDVEVNWIGQGKQREASSVRVTPSQPIENWVKLNASQLAALNADAEGVKRDGFVEIEYRQLEPVVCGPCGSDQEYDEEGNNITGR